MKSLTILTNPMDEALGSIRIPRLKTIMFTVTAQQVLVIQASGVSRRMYLRIIGNNQRGPGCIGLQLTVEGSWDNVGAN
jgi:hypothetical protein